MKRCSKCGIPKEFSDFNKRTSAKDGRQSQCRACNSDNLKDHYDKNKQYYIDKAVKTRNDIRSEIQVIKSVPCADCGVQYPHYVMQFDHLPEFEKLFNICTAYLNHGRQEILAEIEKCEVVCANCHAERSWQRQCGVTLSAGVT